VHTQQEHKFQWAAFGKRDGGSLVANVAAVMCEPALADRDLTNAHELEDRVAVAKRGEKKGGKAFVDKALCVQKAGARALVIINSTDELVSKSSLTLSLARSLALVRSLSRARSLSLSLSHTQTHTHTYT
jgi:hypothetical protein